MSPKELRQLVVTLMVSWAVAWGAVYWISAGRAAKAHEAVAAMTESRDATARAAAYQAQPCSQAGPCPGRSNEAFVRQFLLDRGMSPQLQADQQAYLRSFGLVEAKARAWMVRSAWWGGGGLALGILLLALRGYGAAKV